MEIEFGLRNELVLQLHLQSPVGKTWMTGESLVQVVGCIIPLTISDKVFEPLCQGDISLPQVCGVCSVPKGTVLEKPV